MQDSSSQTSDARVSVNGSRLDILSLSGQLQLARGLSVVAETIGSLVHVERREGEALSDYAERLTATIATLDPTERATLQKALSQILQGLTLRVLTEILRNPTGPDAARLALQFELASYSERDLAEEGVVTSYRQNDGAGGPSPARNDSGSPPSGMLAGAAMAALPDSDAGTPASEVNDTQQRTAAEPVTDPEHDVAQPHKDTTQPLLTKQQSLSTTLSTAAERTMLASATAQQRAVLQSDTYDALLPHFAGGVDEPIAVASAAPAAIAVLDTPLTANDDMANMVAPDAPQSQQRDQMPLPARIGDLPDREASAAAAHEPAWAAAMAQARAAETVSAAPPSQDAILWLQGLTAEPAPVIASADLPLIDIEMDALQDAEITGEQEAHSVTLNATHTAEARQAQIAGEVATEAALGQQVSFERAVLQASGKPGATSTLAENLAMGFTGLVAQQMPVPTAIMPAYVPYPPRPDNADKPQPLIKPVEANDYEEPKGRQKDRQSQDRHGDGDGENDEGADVASEQVPAEAELTAAVPPETAQDYYKRMIGWM